MSGFALLSGLFLCDQPARSIFLLPVVGRVIALIIPFRNVKQYERVSRFAVLSIELCEVFPVVRSFLVGIELCRAFPLLRGSSFHVHCPSGSSSQSHRAVVV